MQVDEELLLTWGATYKKVNKGEYIFREDALPLFYHQVVEGVVEMVNWSDDGKKFIQGIFRAGECFGEPPLFLGEYYPADALAATNGVIIRLSKDSFLQLLRENFQVHYSLLQTLAKRIYRKSLSLKEIACYNPEHRIVALFQALRKDEMNVENGLAKIDLTRQQIADLTGLRVETVIRAIKCLEEKGLLHIRKGKVFVPEF